jgi:hypothetical protein
VAIAKQGCPVLGNAYRAIERGPAAICKVDFPGCPALPIVAGTHINAQRTARRGMCQVANRERLNGEAELLLGGKNAAKAGK